MKLDIEAVYSTYLTKAVNEKPVRITLERKRGWRIPANSVKVARPGPWGNPFVVTEDRSQAEAVQAFRIWLTQEYVTAGLPHRKNWILENLPKLRGKHLACWCKTGPCHADVLLELANS
jgi:hypothetical protein